MFRFLESFEAIDEKRVEVELLDLNIPLYVVLTAAVIDSAGYTTLTICVAKVGLVLTCTRSKWVGSLNLC